MATRDKKLMTAVMDVIAAYGDGESEEAIGLAFASILGQAQAHVGLGGQVRVLQLFVERLSCGILAAQPRYPSLEMNDIMVYCDANTPREAAEIVGRLRRHLGLPLAAWLSAQEDVES